ncbi:hypothetical protein C5L34_000331 [Lentilactobacillus hilgardii]|nr:hypothetical protein C5L34_000331 [Lentilactobacillus hilgardii]
MRMKRINHILGKVLFFDVLGSSAFGEAALIRAIAKCNQSIADIIRALVEFTQAEKKNRH